MVVPFHFFQRLNIKNSMLLKVIVVPRVVLYLEDD